MIDREKVIRALEVCSSVSDGEECPKECPYMGQDVYCIGSSGLMLDALDLLNEQEERIGVLTRAIEKIPKPAKLLDVFGENYEKITRCKDCKYGEHMCQPWSDIVCTQNRATHIPDWFCADGERSEEK